MIILENSNYTQLAVILAAIPFTHIILLSSGVHCPSSVHVKTGLVGTTSPEESFALQLKLTFIPTEM